MGSLKKWPELLTLGQCPDPNVEIQIAEPGVFIHVSCKGCDLVVTETHPFELREDVEGLRTAVIEAQKKFVDRHGYELPPGWV